MSPSEPLTTLIAGGALPVDEAVRIGKEIAGAVSRSGVHGELWPSAISVSDEGVGILPPADADRSRWGQYAAPERILGKPATPASDVFSIGAILFHALAGKPPFTGDSAAQRLLSALADAPAELPPSVPRDVAAVIARCLSREPSARYASPAVLRDALGALGGTRPEFAGRRILLADDEQDIRDAYQRMASRLGIDADVVGSGKEAIEALKARNYDVALLDLNMPRLSGWEVLDFLRARTDRKPRQLFIVTGFADQKISDADRDLVNAVIYKPVAPDELRALMTESLGGGTVNLRTLLRTTKHLSYA